MYGRELIEDKKVYVYSKLNAEAIKLSWISNCTWNEFVGFGMEGKN